MKPQIATTLYHGTGSHPNRRRGIAARRFETAFKGVLVTFASVRRFLSPDQASLVLYTDRHLSPDDHARLAEMEVDVSILPEDSLKYAGNGVISNRFPERLFTMDVMRSIAESNSSEDAYIFIDGDCLFQKHPARLFDALSAGHSVALQLDEPWERSTDGHSRLSLTLLASYYLREVVAPLRYYGGELYGLSPRNLAELVRQLHALWDFVAAQQSLFGTAYTEEHLISILFAIGNYGVRTPEKLIKRVWTADEFCNAAPGDTEFEILHFPSEKDGFFATAYEDLKRDPGLLTRLSAEDYETWLSRPIRERLQPNLGRRVRMAARPIVKNVLSS